VAQPGKKLLDFGGNPDHITYVNSAVRVEFGGVSIILRRIASYCATPQDTGVRQLTRGLATLPPKGGSRSL